MSDAGARLFARYAYPPNELGYCGPDGAAAMLDPDRPAEIARRARQFEGAWSYLEFLAAAPDRQPGGGVGARPVPDPDRPGGAGRGLHRDRTVPATGSPGDLVALHWDWDWDWVCDVISETQRDRLERLEADRHACG
jgi:hypothetical protein